MAEHDEWGQQSAEARHRKHLQRRAHWFARLVQWELELARRATRVGGRHTRPTASKSPHGNGVVTFPMPDLAA